LYNLNSLITEIDITALTRVRIMVTQTTYLIEYQTYVAKCLS
jgi:hypothetical protein